MQQHGHKYLTGRSPPDHGVGVERSKFHFSEQCHVANRIYWNHEMLQHGSKYFTRRPPHPLTLGVKIQLFSEQCNVAYQIKGNHKCIIIVANILPTDIPILRMVSIVYNSTFSEHGHVAYQITGNHVMQQHGQIVQISLFCTELTTENS